MSDHGTPVYAVVYTLMSREQAASRLGNDALDFAGMGIYHTGIEVLGDEYSFGMDPLARHDPDIEGIFAVEPKQAAGDYKESVLLGHVSPALTKQSLRAAIARLDPEWRAVTYHLLRRNCCHFAKALALELSPAFEKTFPSYVLRSAAVGGTVIPDALLARVTAMVAPPPAIPGNLVNVINVPFTWQRPPERPARQRPAVSAEAPPAKSSGAFGSMLGLAKGVAGRVKDTVGNVISDRQRAAYGAAFPEHNPEHLVQQCGVHVVYLNREHDATMFLTFRCVAFANGNQLRRVVALTDIAALGYGAKTSAAARGLPPTMAPSDGPPSEADPALLLYLKDGTMIPVFGFGSLASAVRGAVGGCTAQQQLASLDAAYDELDALWRSALVRAQRGDQLQ